MAMVDGTREAGATVSLVARRRGVSPNQLFTRRRLAEQGALAATQAEEEVVPASAFRAQQDMIRELQRLLGKKTLETDILMRRRGLARLAFFDPGSQAFFHRVMSDSQHNQDIHLDFTYQDVSRGCYVLSHWFDSYLRAWRAFASRIPLTCQTTSGRWWFPI